MRGPRPSINYMSDQIGGGTVLKKILIVVLIVGGLALIAAPFIQDFMVGRVTENHLNALDPDRFEENLAAEAIFDFGAIRSIDIQDVLAAANEDLPGIGIISIPQVDLRLPIFNGVTNETLSAGAGTMKAGQVMGEGNFSLASHRMNHPDLLFTPLERVEVGDEVLLQDAHWVYVYEVTLIQVIEPERVEVIHDSQGEGLLTLITCTPDNLRRLMVRGQLREIRPL